MSEGGGLGEQRTGDIIVRPRRERTAKIGGGLGKPAGDIVGVARQVGGQEGLLCRGKRRRNPALRRIGMA